MPEEQATEEGPGLTEQLRDAIRQSGQSLNQISLACGVGSDRLSRFMRGKRDLTLDAVEKICRWLQLRLTSYREGGAQQPASDSPSPPAPPEAPPHEAKPAEGKAARKPKKK